jgi:hypothetical protein
MNGATRAPESISPKGTTRALRAAAEVVAQLGDGWRKANLVVSQVEQQAHSEFPDRQTKRIMHVLYSSLL